MRVAIMEGKGRGDCNHTDTTRCHIGGNHNRAFPVLKLTEHPVALSLLFVAVDG
jgi:hypothetical protein